MCSKKYHNLPQSNVRPKFRYFPGKNPHEWPHKRAVLCGHLLSFISPNVPLLFRIPAEWTASNLRTAPPEMVETLSASQHNFTLRCSRIVQHWPFRQFCPKAMYLRVHRGFRACWLGSRFVTPSLNPLIFALVAPFLNFKEPFLQICKGRRFLRHPFSQFWEKPGTFAQKWAKDHEITCRIIWPGEMPSQTDAILHRLPRSSILRSHSSGSARGEHFVHPLQQEALLISEKNIVSYAEKRIISSGNRTGLLGQNV